MSRARELSKCHDGAGVTLAQSSDVAVRMGGLAGRLAIAVLVVVNVVAVARVAAGLGATAAATLQESRGLTLFAPIRSTITYLVDANGRVVHQWESDTTPGHAVYLLDDGHLLRTGREERTRFSGGGQGGRIQEIDRNGTVLWDFSFADRERLQHHDIEPLPNGNLLLIAWERHSLEEAVATGRAPASMPGGELWSDAVFEIRPVPPEGGDIVWEWHAWDHLVQARDPEAPEYGEVAARPRRIDANAGESLERRRREGSPEQLARLRDLGYLGGGRGRPARRIAGPGGGPVGADWLHVNSVAYNAELDQILLSVRNLSEIWVIDHSTTTDEAAASTGGRGGHGGDLLYRWGNPSIRGESGMVQQLFVQHDAHWIPDGLPGAGNVLIFNNGEGRPDGDYSTVLELRLPLDSADSYRDDGHGGFAEPQPVWQFRGSDSTPLYSARLSGAQRLESGNTLICEGESGRFLEVTPQGRVVWQLTNPFRDPQPRRGSGSDAPASGAVFRATRIALDSPALAYLRAGDS